MKQTTVAQSVSISGKGLHTGREVTLTFKPAKSDTGFVFKRVDLDGEPEVPALAKWVNKTKRSTVLECNGVEIQTSEHVLAALTGLDYDNVLIELNATEPPIMDGSARFFIEALERAGVKELDADREVYIVTEPIHYKDAETGSEVIILPSDQYEVQVMVDFGTKILGTQNASLYQISDFKEEIADARTFSFLHDIETLLDQGLIRGGDLNNAIVYVDTELSEPTLEKLKKAFKKEDISVTTNGILNNLELKYPNEAARHKLLDVIGDLALIGTKIRGRVIACKPGHFVNTEFAKVMSKRIKDERRKRLPKIDIYKEPVMDTVQIMDMLPHRPPFLLVDKILELTDSRVVGLKNVTMNEAFFIGHFPGAPVMPGVLQIEAMAQTGGVLVLNTVPDPENYLTFFMKMDNVKFKHQVNPGDTLVFDCELITPIRRGICHMRALAFVGDKLVSEAELMAQIVKTK
ncbi:MAG: bifunctional UDP-3-O-[3-hydroxymyristoyl] N-acetylglucosamine deacetylase/3-hydroxyacyl-ACP dehydratase [Bacteroidetes bacterium]|nr:bifunctional UDP-3-O-[3-hydroxymyristoyl] N-acetylglucosamine deacetylase/3-hydroxyacyl-ACP dehydratase [Bacteroidota bacterium]